MSTHVLHFRLITSMDYITAVCPQSLFAWPMGICQSLAMLIAMISWADGADPAIQASGAIDLTSKAASIQVGNVLTGMNYHRAVKVRNPTNNKLWVLRANNNCPCFFMNKAEVPPQSEATFDFITVAPTQEHALQDSFLVDVKEDINGDVLTSLSVKVQGQVVDLITEDGNFGIYDIGRVPSVGNERFKYDIPVEQSTFSRANLPWDKLEPTVACPGFSASSQQTENGHWLIELSFDPNTLERLGYYSIPIEIHFINNGSQLDFKKMKQISIFIDNGTRIAPARINLGQIYNNVPIDKTIRHSPELTIDSIQIIESGDFGVTPTFTLQGVTESKNEAGPSKPGHDKQQAGECRFMMTFKRQADPDSPQLESRGGSIKVFGTLIIHGHTNERSIVIGVGFSGIFSPLPPGATAP